MVIPMDMTDSYAGTNGSYTQDDLNRLLEPARHSIKQNFTPAELNARAAMLFNQTGDTQSARDYAGRARELASEDPGLLMSLGPVLCDAGDIDGGISALEEALALCEGSDDTGMKIDILHNLKVAYIKKGDDETAKQYFAQLRELQLFEVFKANVATKYQSGMAAGAAGSRFGPGSSRGFTAEDYIEMFERINAGEDPADVINSVSRDVISRRARH